ncbi:hypothetical protein ABEF95_017025 [Exophiala dermatitidis]
MLFPPGSFPHGPPIETKKALLLLDFQNDFVSPEGKLPVANVPSFLPQLLSLVSDFREKGHVIWVGTEYKQPRSTISSTTGSHSILLKQFLSDQGQNEEQSASLPDPAHTPSSSEDPLSSSSKPDAIHDREAFLTETTYRCCIPGTSGSDYPALIKHAIDSQRDLLIAKSHYSAFVDSPLLTHLRTRLITELYVCGSLSNIAVYATVLDAVCHGLQVTVVEDCLGFNEENCHVEAMRQMADHMGANGVDCQELRDDLAGLLGDVIPEDQYTTTLQVSLALPRLRRPGTSRKHIHDWMAGLEGQDIASSRTENVGAVPEDGTGRASNGRDSYTKSESSRRTVKPTSPDNGGPCERTTCDGSSPEDPTLRYASQPLIPRSSRPGHSSEKLKLKQSESSAEEKHPSIRFSKRSPSPPYDTGILWQGSGKDAGTDEPALPDHQQSRGDGPASQAPRGRHPSRSRQKMAAPKFIGPNDRIGEGDCRLVLDLLDPDEAERAFYSCKESIRWQKMYHRTGEVPRLVAVQGEVTEDGTCMPIYRHPADESPELFPFHPTVDVLRIAAEKAVGHRLNHVLLQWYRNGEDHISEHSDKTLDIVRGSTIVNVSLGAQRTMTLRTKSSAVTVVADDGSRQSDFVRPCQRIRLPHNSLFALGQETNRLWLHAIRADKRPASLKDPEELAFSGERISLTFRHIGTFINPRDNTIWGQGATGKQREGAKRLLTGSEAEQEGESMIRAFGQENHRSNNWDWDECYGKGFDVVNFQTMKASAD